MPWSCVSGSGVLRFRSYTSLQPLLSMCSARCTRVFLETFKPLCCKYDNPVSWETGSVSTKAADSQNCAIEATQQTRSLQRLDAIRLGVVAWALEKWAVSYPNCDNNTHNEEFGTGKSW